MIPAMQPAVELFASSSVWDTIVQSGTDSFAIVYIYGYKTNGQVRVCLHIPGKSCMLACVMRACVRVCGHACVYDRVMYRNRHCNYFVVTVSSVLHLHTVRRRRDPTFIQNASSADVTKSLKDEVNLPRPRMFLCLRAAND